jgi:glycosyltransferase involved in cell wall biosynthesis
MPKVSVIIPNYNHARFLPKRIESVLGQTFQDFDLILLDDCSTDDSRSIMLEYAADARVRVESNQVNSGNPFKQWNKGVRLARGKYIWMAESDDYADERLLERLVPVLDDDEAISFAYCRSWLVRDHDRTEGLADLYLNSLDPHRWTIDFTMDGREAFDKYFALKNPVPNASAVIFRKIAYQNVGAADESFRLCGDWKLWASMASMGKIAFVAEPLNFFRSHGTTVRNRTGTSKADVLEYLRVARWITEHGSFSVAMLERIREERANMWVPAVMSLHVAWPMKREILKCARAIDPHLLRSAVRPALRTIRMKFLRYWRSLLSKSVSVIPA